jgi:hypothetical protein
MASAMLLTICAKWMQRRRTVDKVMVGVTEYDEGLDVKLTYVKDRPVIWAANEAGYCSTLVDLVELLEWVKVNMPELMPSSALPHLARAPHG